jgi:hypothetical protein
VSARCLVQQYTEKRKESEVEVKDAKTVFALAALENETAITVINEVIINYYRSI